jgi:signal peptidase I
MNKYLLIAGIVLMMLVSTIAFSATYEKSSPYDHITQDKILVGKDKVVINLPGAQWATFTDTNSMDPIFDAESNTIEIKPLSPDDVHVGDIVSYKSNLVDGILVHRVAAIDYDSQGWYATLKGDNNFFSDPESVRFDQINGVVVAVIY